MTPNLILIYRICNVNTVHPKRIFNVNTAISSALTEYTAEIPYHAYTVRCRSKKPIMYSPHSICSVFESNIVYTVHPRKITSYRKNLLISAATDYISELRPICLLSPGQKKKLEAQGRTRQYFAGYKIYPPANPEGYPARISFLQNFLVYSKKIFR
jgi:hypothetical protein